MHSDNNFPTGAGLASSASAFAALAVAATQALDLSSSPQELSRLARQGSGSAARSIFGGFAQMHCGSRADGQDAYAEAVAEATAWPLQVVVGITTLAKKDVGSTEGMERTRITAPYYASWVDSAPADLKAARAHVAARDFAALAELAEHSCLKMHAVAMAARPPLIYWSPATLAGLQTVQKLRQQGLPVFFTVDAGPQIKAVCLPEAVPTVETALRALPGVQQILTAGLGEGARRIAPWAHEAVS